MPCRMASLYKYELVVFLPLKITQFFHLLPSLCPLLRDCLGYTPFSPHTVSSRATCSPRRLNPCIPRGCRLASSCRCGGSAHLSFVSTSKQKRLSVDSVFRRMQDFSVRSVGNCRVREREKEREKVGTRGFPDVGGGFVVTNRFFFH